MRNIFLPLTRSAAFQKEPDCDGRNRRTSWTVGCSVSSVMHHYKYCWSYSVLQVPWGSINTYFPRTAKWSCVLRLLHHKKRPMPRWKYDGRDEFCNKTMERHIFQCLWLWRSCKYFAITFWIMTTGLDSKYSKYLKYLPAWRGQDAPKWWTPWWQGACWWGERSHSGNIIFTIFDLFLKSIRASTHLNWDICLDNPSIDGSPAMPCTMSNNIKYTIYNINEKVSDVPESRVWFANKNLTSCRMH